MSLMSYITRRLPRLTSLVFSAGLAFGANHALATPYSDFYLFGDSLSDTGNMQLVSGGAVPPAPYFNGRFTNGPNWADRFAAESGLFTSPQTPLLPGSLLGNVGDNYAWGGARTYGHSIPALNSLARLSSQVGAFASQHGGVADPNALYVVWIGANDMQDAIGAAVTSYQNALIGGATVAAAQQTAMQDIDSAVSLAITNINSAIATLMLMGADEFLVANLPDLVLTPRLAPGGIFSQYASMTFNNALLSLLQTRPGTAHLYDVYSAFNEVVANPAAYGFTNADAACYTGDDLTFVPGGPVCATPDAYVFWDTIHPSAATHALIERGMVAALSGTIPEPASFALLAAGLFAIGGVRRGAPRQN
ncbi:MAG: hypothetical protein KF778_02315 [Rhodocyclaceae bacterium]|nr:hypothetical protein [Rhodocyclaceae bacterium]MBX3667209.1 hypothetical protein [Rhodocyclaceae bacterium]